eukprot:gene8536-14537_t
MRRNKDFRIEKSTTHAGDNKEYIKTKDMLSSGCIKKRDGIIVMSKEEILDRWEEYIAELYDDERDGHATVFFNIGGASMQHRTRLFHDDVISDLLLNRTLQQTINQYNVKFDVRKFNTSSMTSKSIEILNINGFERMSFIIDTAVTSKVPKGAARILHVPLIETGSLLHFKTIPNRDDSVNRNELSMIPDAHYRSTVAAKLLHMLSWTHVVVVFQVKRINDLDHFIRSFAKGTVLAILPVEETVNGSITHHSVARIKSLATGNFSAVLLIYDEAGLPELFQLIRSDDVDLCSVRINILLLDLIFRDKLNVCNLHTVVGLQVQMNGSSEGSTHHRSHLEVLGADPTLGNLLLYDALNLVANITSKLASSNRWLSSSRNGKGIIQSIRIANTANFTAALDQGTFDGASGNIEFNANGTRVNMPLNVANIKENKLLKIGTVTENTDIKLKKNPSMNIEYHLDSILINDHIKVVTVETEPFTFVTKNPNGTVSYSGLCIDILDKLAQMMNFTYSIYLVEDGEYGRKDGDKWTGMIGDVLYKKADIAVASLTITSIREEAIEFTRPFMELQNAYLRKRSTTVQFDYLQFLKPFTTNVWILTVIVVLISSIVIYFVDYNSPFGWRQSDLVSTGKYGDEFSAANSIWFCTASWLLQGGDNTPRSLSGRLFVFVLWFAVLIVTSTYTANMAAYFTFAKAKAETGDLEALLKEGVSFIIKPHIAIDQFLKSSEYKIYQLITQKIQQEKSYANRSVGIEMLQRDSNAVMLSEAPYAEWSVNKGLCDIQIVKGILPSRGYGFPLRKGSPLQQKLSIGISYLEESQFMHERINYYWKELSVCKPSSETWSDGRIRPEQLVGVYACLLIGITISFLLLFLEKWWKKIPLRKKQDADK